MYRAIIHSDDHYCKNSSIVRGRGEKYSVRLHNLINSLQWVEDLADKYNCDEVLCGGDFFNSCELGAEEITALYEIKFSNRMHRYIIGNHEANIANLEYSTVNIFSDGNSDVISDVKCIDVSNNVELYFIPYISNGAILHIKDYLHDNNKKKIVLSHNDLAGVRYGQFLSTSGFEVSEIGNSCTLFINGHLHNSYMMNNNIVLLGNLTGQNFTEDAEKYSHYAWLLTVDDDDKITLDPIENPYAFNFYRLKILKSGDISILDKLKNNAVISIQCEDKFIPRVEAKLALMENVINYKLIAIYNNASVGEMFEDELVEVSDHLQQFINFIKEKVAASPELAEELTILRGN